MAHHQTNRPAFPKQSMECVANEQQNLSLEANEWISGQSVICVIQWKAGSPKSGWSPNFEAQ